MGPFLILARQPTVSSYISVEDGGELAGQTFFHAGAPLRELGRFGNDTARVLR